MAFEYYYGTQADQFSFIRIPKVLLIEESFSNLSLQAKILYAVLLDRMSLSRRNGWLDSEDRVFIIYQIKEMGEDLGISEKKVRALMKELTDFGLLEKKRRGLGLPNILYVKSFMTGIESAESGNQKKAKVDKSEKTDDRDADLGSSEMEDSVPVNIMSQVTSHSGTAEMKTSESVSVSRTAETGTSGMDENPCEIWKNDVNKGQVTGEDLFSLENNAENAEQFGEKGGTECPDTYQTGGVYYREATGIPEKSESRTVDMGRSGNCDPESMEAILPGSSRSDHLGGSRTTRLDSSRSDCLGGSRTAHLGSSGTSDSAVQELPVWAPLMNKTKINNTDRNQTEANHIESNHIISEASKEQTLRGMRFDEIGEEELSACREEVAKNINADDLSVVFPGEQDLIEEIVDLIIEVLLSRRKAFQISGDMKPAELVKRRFRKLNYDHIEYVITCLKGNTTKVYNIKQYMLASLFNAPATISGYYRAEVNYYMPELASGK